MKKWQVIGVVGACIASGPMVVQARPTTTLQYIGSTVTGTATSLSDGYTYPAPLPSSAFTGTLTGYITLGGSASAGDLTLDDYQFILRADDGILLGFSDGPGPFVGGGAYPQFESYQGGYIDLTTSRTGSITGANVSLIADPYHGPASSLTIGPSGISFYYQYATALGACENLIQYDGTPYTGTAVNPCTAGGGSSTAGKWKVTAAPELDPSLAFGGLTLLLGVLAIVRSRRVVTEY